MSNISKIEWTELTWNPITGCSKISPGCENCYAEIMSIRLKSMGVRGYENGFNVSIIEERLSQPLLRKKPTIYFVNSMSDIFHDAVPESFIDKIFEIIRLTPCHIYQILTKRSTRMELYFSKNIIPSNAWIGVSVENVKHGLPRIDKLKKINANVRFLSIEPLLEDIGNIDLQGINWVIVGGESGQKARPMKKEWVLRIKNQCKSKNIPFFFKQWGRWGEDGEKRSKKANGRELDGRVFNEMPPVDNAK